MMEHDGAFSKTGYCHYYHDLSDMLALIKYYRVIIHVEPMDDVASIEGQKEVKSMWRSDNLVSRERIATVTFFLFLRSRWKKMEVI